MNRDSYSDLINRLRMQQFTATGDRIIDTLAGQIVEMCAEAADAIERLRGPSVPDSGSVGPWKECVYKHPDAPLPAPEWYYSPIEGRLYSSKFENDAALDLTGDFADDDQKRAYAEKVCALLNSTPATTRPIEKEKP